MKKLLVLGTMAAALFVADADAFTKAGKAKNDQYQRNAIGIQDDNADEAFAQPIQDACTKLNALAKGLNVNKMYPASKYSKEDIKLAKDSKTKLTRATNSMKTLATIFTANKNGKDVSEETMAGYGENIRDALRVLMENDQIMAQWKGELTTVFGLLKTAVAKQGNPNLSATHKETAQFANIIAGLAGACETILEAGQGHQELMTADATTTSAAAKATTQAPAATTSSRSRARRR